MSMNWKTQYNNLMFDIAFEYNTIGTRFSESTEDWNLRDAVSETQYTLDLFKDEDSIFWADAHDPSQRGRAWYNEWRNNINRMTRFINRWKDDALKMHCTSIHFSEYDG